MARVWRRSFKKPGRLIPKRGQGLRAQAVRLTAGAVMPWHTTGLREELLLVIAGRIRVELKRGDKILASGECLYLPSGTPHQVVNRSRTPARYVYVTGAAGR